MNYNGKPLNDHTNDELLAICHTFVIAEQRREDASKHEKFNVERVIGEKKIPKMQFPPPNPAFVKLKLEIQAEMKNRGMIK
jgi:hypothetical protein